MDVLVLSSGGIDSSALFHFYKGLGHKVGALFIDYGQPSVASERSALNKLCTHHGIPLSESRISHARTIKAGETIGRNAILLTIAMLNIEFNTGLVGLGVHDHTGYADCTEGFVNNMQRIFDIYFDGKVRVDAPFLNWSKNDIWQYSIQNQLPLEHTYSCELGLPQPCGQCASCSDLEKLYETS